MSMLSTFIYGYRRIVSAGVEAIMRDAIEFVGATVEDDPITKRTRVTFNPTGLPAGVANQLLQHNGVEWKAVSGIDTARITTGGLPAIRGGTGYSGYAVGDLLYGAGPILLGRLAVGAAGKVVRSNGTLPVYEYLSTLHNAAGTNLVQIGGNVAPATGQVVALTDDGGFAIRMTNRTGQESVKGSVLQVDRTWVITSTTQLSSLSLIGVTMANTDAGRVYLQVINQNPDVTVWVWADAARTVKVASGTLVNCWADGGSVDLSPVGGSGMSGSVTVVASAADENLGVATHGTTNGVQLPSGSSPLTGVMYSSEVADGSDVWVVIAGKAYVLTMAGAAMGGYLLISGEAAPDHAKVRCDLASTDYDTYGVGMALERVTSGLVLAQLDLRGFGPGIPEH